MSTVEGGRRGGGSLGVKQLRNVVMPSELLVSGRRAQVVIARENAADWRVAQPK